MTSHSARRRPVKGGWRMVAPALFVLAVLTLWPLGRAVRSSLYTESLTTPDDTSFAGDLEFDSLTVMDFVAAIEDEFEIIISMNQQAEIETYGQLVDAVQRMAA